MIPNGYPAKEADMARLTDIAVRNLKAGAERQEIPDAAQRGLHIIVQPTGAKVFAVRYRFAGKTRKLTLQAGIGLAAARREAADALYQVERGIDPAVEKQRSRDEQRAAAADTLEKVAAEFFKRDGAKIRSARDWQRDLVRQVFPPLGQRPIADIRRKDIIRLLDDIEDSAGSAQADTVLAIVRRIMNWHAVRDDSFRSPIVRGMRRLKPSEHARARILTDDEIRRIWQAADAMPGPFGHYVKFLLLTAARRNEAAHLRWQEIVGTEWTLPGARNKVKKDLVRPLSAAALAVLTKTPRIAGSDFVFSADGRRLGGMTRRKKEIDTASGVAGWQLHDLRRTAKTLMARAGVAPHVSERCLGHVIGGVEGVYDRHSYRDEMLNAYERLAAVIGQIVEPQANVTMMAR
jgi:integrase